jgi:hypothetical protein
MFGYQSRLREPRHLLPMIALLCACATPAWSWGQQDVFIVRDEHGNVEFTDSPRSTTGASVQRVEIREPNTAPPPTPAPRATTEQQPAQAATPPEPTVTITSPANEATIAMGPGNFTVSAAVAPALSRTERLVLMMDGQPVGAPQESASWFIEGALRGPHDLVVQRTTTRGKTIALSEPVRVYVLRPSIR